MKDGTLLKQYTYTLCTVHQYNTLNHTLYYTVYIYMYVHKHRPRRICMLHGASLAIGNIVRIILPHIKDGHEVPHSSLSIVWPEYSLARHVDSVHTIARAQLLNLHLMVSSGILLYSMQAGNHSIQVLSPRICLRDLQRTLQSLYLLVPMVAA